MGHLVGKDIYRDLGRKIDHLATRVPWNDTLHDILRELYSKEEADLVVRMPHGLSTLNRVERVSGVDRPRLEHLLESLCDKVLICCSLSEPSVASDLSICSSTIGYTY